MFMLLLVLMGHDPTYLPPPAGPGAMAHHLVTDEQGIMMSWLEPVDPETDSQVLRLQLARFDGTTWSKPVTVVQRNDFFANWADVPVVTVNTNAWVATWLQKSGPGTYAYDISVARSDDGLTWTHMGTLNDDRTETEHGFVSLVPDDGGIRAFWLDGREMDGAADEHGHGSGAMALRTSLISDHIGRSRVIDAMVCECCPTSATMTSKGPIVLVRNRTEEEIRDIEVLRAEDDYASPTMLHKDDWAIAGCPVNGPVVKAEGEHVAAAWYTAAPERTGVWVAFSTDAGEHFSDPILVDDHKAIGRVGLVLMPDGRALVSWLQEGEHGAQVSLRTVYNDGHLTPVHSVASVSASRLSGIPRMTHVPGQPDDVLVVWIEMVDEHTTLNATVIPTDTSSKVKTP